MTPVLPPSKKRASAADEPVGDSPAAGDFRVRVAREKRQRMRERLTQATMDAYLEAPPGARPVIDDVVRLAGVSRGSFYKYFDSVDEIVEELGQQMMEATLASFDRVFKGLHDPAARVAAGPLLSLCHAAMEPRHVAFVSRVNFVHYMARADLHGGAVVKRYLIDARDAGAFRFDSMHAALDLIVGASREAALRILEDPRLDAAYIRELTTMTLLGLGMNRKAAERAVKAAWEHFLQHAGELPWWRPVVAV